MTQPTSPPRAAGSLRAVVLFSVWYAFAVLGMSLFGGKLNSRTGLVAQSSYGLHDYYTLTFDDLPRAMIALFYILVGNNWPILSEVRGAATSARAPRGSRTARARRAASPRRRGGRASSSSHSTSSSPSSSPTCSSPSCWTRTPSRG